MSLFASLDIGSNTLRLLIGRFAGRKIIDIETGRKITRLGSMVEKTGILQPGAMDASLNVLLEFLSAIRRYGVTNVRAVATSALREARNSASFIHQVREQTGIRIEVISGEKEAELTLRGILYAFPKAEVGTMNRSRSAPAAGDADDSCRHPLFIMDIGGGSSEWIHYQGAGKTVMGSLPAGVIKLLQKCITSDPVSDSDIECLNHEIHSACAPLESYTQHLKPESTLFIGTGGTFTTIASVDLGLADYSREKIHLHRIPLTGLLTMREKMLRLSLTERENIQGLEPGRADLIIPGLQFTMKVMETLRFNELIISDYGLLEGVLLEMKEAIEKGLPEAGKP